MVYTLKKMHRFDGADSSPISLIPYIAIALFLGGCVSFLETILKRSMFVSTIRPELRRPTWTRHNVNYAPWIQAVQAVVQYNWDKTQTIDLYDMAKSLAGVIRDRRRTAAYQTGQRNRWGKRRCVTQICGQCTTGQTTRWERCVLFLAKEKKK